MQRHIKSPSRAIAANRDRRKTSSVLVSITARKLNVGEHLQPILFTHHRFVADMAKEALEDQVDILSL